MLTIHWESRITGATGHGSPLRDDVARVWLSQRIKNQPQIRHWLVSSKTQTAGPEGPADGG